MNKKDAYIIRIYLKNKLLYKELIDISDIQFNDGIEDYLKYVRIDIHKATNTYIHKNIINKNVMLSGTITCLANSNNSKKYQVYDLSITYHDDTMYVLRGKCDIENENDIKRFSIEDTIFSTAEYMVENNDVYESMVNPKSFYKNGYYDDVFDKNNFYDRTFRSKFDYLLDDYGEDIYY